MTSTRARLILGALQLAALGVVSGLGASAAGFPLDDAWIHALAARTFVEHGTLGIVPGAHGAGATSLLWALLLTPASALGIPMPAYALILNSALYVATGQFALTLMLNGGASAMRALPLATAFSTAPNFVWFAASGMEATLVCLLSVAAISTWFSTRPLSSLWSGAALGALALTRPEGALLVPLLVLLKRPSSIREAALAGLGPAVAVLGQAAVALVKTGQIWPATLEGRRWMWLAPLEGQSRVSKALLLLEDWIDRLSEFTLGYTGGFLFWLALGLALCGLPSIWRRPAERALVIWCLAHVAIYAVTLPTFGHGGRYQPLLPAVFLWLMCEGARRVVLSLVPLAPSRQRLLGLVLGSTFTILLAWGPLRSLLAWGGAQRDAIRHVNDTELGMARRLGAIAPDAVIASFDIGAIGFFSGRPIVELGGLTEKSIVPLLWSGKVGDHLRQHRVDYVVVPLGLGGEGAPEPWNFGYRLGLFQDPKLGLTPVETLESKLEVWRHGLRYTMHCSPRQTLYRVEYAETPP